MKYSYNWIQSHIAEKLPEPEVLKEKIIFHAFEVEDVEIVADDTIFDIKVLPDRAGDCLSHYGMAREIAGLYGYTLNTVFPKVIEHINPVVPGIEVQTDLCKRYRAIRIDDVTVGESPAWLRTALESIGQKSINSVVDIANFVMFDTGQPVHVFDTTKIDGGVVVRFAKEGESIVTLSDEHKQLRTENVVIADYLGALAIAGVKGGKSAEVTKDTTSILIEVASFDAISVRKTSRMLNLITDASRRFENIVSEDLVPIAAMQMVDRIQEVCGGVVSGVTEYYPNQHESRVIYFDQKDINKLLGDWITTKDIETIFDRYHYKYQSVGTTYTLTVPSWRADITGAHDVAEEVGRVLGYDRIDPLPLPFKPEVAHHIVDKQITAAKKWLIEKGFSEVMNYSFRKKGEVYVSYGAKDKSALRTNLSDGLKESFDINRLNVPLLGVKSIKIFEIGAVFFSDKESIHVATLDGGVIVEVPLEQFIVENNIDINATDLRLSDSAQTFNMWSSYPFIARDIAVWLDSPVDKSMFEEVLFDFAHEYCVREPYTIDEFSKNGRTSVAYRLIFQAQNRTLTESEVHGWWQILLEKLLAKKPFEIR